MSLDDKLSVNNIPDLPDKLFYLALNSAVDSVVITKSNGKILWVNNAFEKLTGYSYVEALDCDTSLLKSGKQSRSFYENMWKTLLDGKIWQGELWNKKKSGDIYLEEQTITPVTDESNKIAHFIAIKRDISEKIADKKRLEHIDKMEAIGRIVGGISHNFNNKLSAISGFNQLALEWAESHSVAYEHLISYLNQMQKAKNEAAGLIQDLQMFCRGNKQRLNTCILASEVENVVDQIKKSLPANITLTFNHNNHFDEVNIDNILVNQLLLILTQNAQNAFKNGGDISIDILNSTVDNQYCNSCHQSIKGEFLTLSIQDNGEGINKEDLKNLFFPFYSAKHSYSNAGMGLSILHGIMHEHGGHVLLNSKRNEGTKLCLLFPLTNQSTVIEKDKKHQLNHQQKKQILVVLTQSKNNGLVELLTKMTELEVVIKTDAQSAISCVLQHPEQYCLLITEQNILGVSAIFLIKAIKNIRPDIPTVLIKQNAMENFNDLCEFNGLVDDFIEKPLEEKRLLTLITKVTSNET